MGLTTDEEVGVDAEAVNGALHLEEALLRGVEEDHAAVLGEAGGHGEEGRGLAGARLAGEHGHHGGREPLATEALIDPLDAGEVTLQELHRHANVVDVGTNREGVGERDTHDVSFS